MAIYDANFIDASLNSFVIMNRTVRIFTLKPHGMLFLQVIRILCVISNESNSTIHI